MATAKLILDKRRKDLSLIDITNNIDKNKYPLRIRIYKGTENKEITLKYKFTVNEWIEGENRVDKSYPNSVRVNASIQQRFSIATTVLSEYDTVIENMDIESVKNLVSTEIEKKINPKVSEDAQQIIDSSLSREESQLWLEKFAAVVCERTRKKGKSGTAKWYEDAVAAIKKLNKEKDILIVKIDVAFLENFEAHHISKGNSINGIGVYLRAIRSLTNKALKEILKGKIYEGYPWGRGGYSIRTEKTKKRAVNRKVIDDIRNLKLEEGGADWKAQKYLLFMFNNRGINLIDVAKLKRRQIVNATYKREKLVAGRLEYKRSKNGKEFSMKLTDESLSILNSFDIYNKNENDFVFPIGYTESKTGLETYMQKRKRINAKFSELAESAGHEGVNVTTYVIRHTWGTEAKKKGMSIAMIQDAYGHDDPRTTQTYTDYFEESVLDEMNEKVLAG